jgi:hypothetical protein
MRDPTEGQASLRHRGRGVHVGRHAGTAALRVCGPHPQRSPGCQHLTGSFGTYLNTQLGIPFPALPAAS